MLLLPASSVVIRARQLNLGYYPLYQIGGSILQKRFVARKDTNPKGVMNCGEKLITLRVTYRTTGYRQARSIGDQNLQQNAYQTSFLNQFSLPPSCS